MKIFPVMILIASMLAACAGPEQWQAPPGTSSSAPPGASSFERDYAQCDYEATLATAGSNARGLAGGFALGMRQADLINRCLTARGYQRR